MHADLKAVESLDTNAEHEPGADERNASAATVPVKNDHPRKRPNWDEVETRQLVIDRQALELAALRSENASQARLIEKRDGVIEEVENSLAYARQEKDAILRRLHKWSGFWFLVGGLVCGVLARAL